MKASIFETTMNDQILKQQNQEIQKQNQKKQHERRAADTTQLEVVQEETKLQGKRRKHGTLLTKRRRVAEALNKKQIKTTKASKNQKTSKTKLGKLAKPTTVKETSQEETKETHLGGKLTPAAESMIKHFSLQVLGRNLRFSDELEDLEFLENPEELDETSETNETTTSQSGKAKTTTKTKGSKLVQDHMAKLSPKDKKEYLAKLLNGNSKEILDTLINPKYMIGCTMTPEELLLLRKQIQKKARFLRGVIGKSIPEGLRVVRELGYGGGLGALGGDDSGLGQGAPKPSSDESPNSAILESMEAALDLTSLLEQLGVKSNILETNIESTTATEQVKESEAISKKNLDSIEKNAHRSECAKVIKILSYVAAAILCLVGQPEAGLLIIATTSGLMALVLTQLAHLLGVSEFGLKCMIMITTLIISIISANPAVMGDEAESLLTSFGRMMIVSATIGFTTDLLGVIATGHTDSDDYPAWVNYAAMGINFAAMLPEIGLGIYRGVSRGLARMASTAADKAAVEASAAEAAANVAKAESSTAQEAAEGVCTGVGGAETGGSTAGEGAQGASGQGGAAGEANPMGGAEGSPTQAGGSPTAAASTPESAASAPTTSSDAVSSSAVAVDGGAGSAESLDAPTVSSPGAPVTGQMAKAGDGAPIRSTEEGAAKADKIEETKKVAAGGDANPAGLDSQGGSTGPGSAAYKADQAAAGDTELMEEAKDPFTTKVEKIGEAIKKAKADLARLEGLEEGGAEGSVEEAAEYAGKLQTAQKAVEDAEAALENVTAAQEKVAQTEGEAAAAQETLANAKERLAKVEVKAPSAKQGKIAKMKAYLNAKFGDIGKILLLANTGGETYAQFKMAEIDTELGQIMAEVADMTGNYELLNAFFEVIGAAQQSTNTRNEQYSKDLHDEIKLVGDIINAERSASNILMSA